MNKDKLLENSIREFTETLISESMLDETRYIKVVSFDENDEAYIVLLDYFYDKDYHDMIKYMMQYDYDDDSEEVISDIYSNHRTIINVYNEYILTLIDTSEGYIFELWKTYDDIQ